MIRRMGVSVFVLYLFSAFIFVPFVMSQTRLQYTLSMPDPSTHYFEVELSFTNLPPRGSIDLKMPVWTPGSYLVREYARHVDRFEASVNGKRADAAKVRKNVWRIKTENNSELTVHYRLYAYEHTVRTNFLDDLHGFANGAATFMYVDELKHLPIELTVQPYSDWKTVSVALPGYQKKPYTYLAEDFDTLVDSPIEIGNHQELHFEAAGIAHRIAMVGDYTPFELEKLISDYRRVCEAALSVVGEHPCTDYLFIVHHIPEGRGGLEHKNSTALITPQHTYASANAYADFMGLVSHEYFHLWNVKRIRPLELGPFDYENENYTHLLWMAEGFTSMYDNHILRRAGLRSETEYLADVAADFTYVSNTPGCQEQSLTEASWDAWIKYYRPNENSSNTQTSYYVKGAAVTTLLNLEILHATQGEKSLDEVMKYLWKEYYQDKKRGFTELEIQQAVERIARKPLDGFFKNYIWGTTALDVNAYLAYVGCQLVDKAAGNQQPFLGAAFSPQNKVTVVRTGSPAHRAGLDPGDQVIALNGQPATDVLATINTTCVPDQRITLDILRGTSKRTISLTLTYNPLKNWHIVRLAEVSVQQEELYRRWLWVPIQQSG
ncbi:MAG: PDZ domain-containing protein [Siphonobacter sp.]